MTRKKVVSIRLAEEQVEDLYRTARRLGRTPSQTAAMLVDEGLRRERFPQIEMRDTAAGRIAYIKGHRLPVWMVARRMWRGEIPEDVAASLKVSPSVIREALVYAELFRDEIEQEVEAAEHNERHIEQVLPGVIVYRPDAAAS